MLKDYSKDVFIPFYVLRDRLSKYGWVYGFSMTGSHSLGTVRCFKNSNPTRILVSGVFIVFNKDHKQELIGYVNDLKKEISEVLII